MKNYLGIRIWDSCIFYIITDQNKKIIYTAYENINKILEGLQLSATIKYAPSLQNNNTDITIEEITHLSKREINNLIDNLLEYSVDFLFKKYDINDVFLFDSFYPVVESIFQRETLIKVYRNIINRIISSKKTFYNFKDDKENHSYNLKNKDGIQINIPYSEIQKLNFTAKDIISDSDYEEYYYYAVFYMELYKMITVADTLIRRKINNMNEGALLYESTNNFKTSS